MHIVLVHGFLNRGGILQRLAAHLSRLGHICHTPSLKPCDARSGLPALAQQLDRYIRNNLPEDASFALIGFSMGALVSRYYLQELDGAKRVRGFFSIAGPHAGTVSAYIYPGEGVAQMRPHSDFLQALERSASRLDGLPVTCYWTPYDAMIRPLASARWQRGEQVRIPSLVHSLLVFDQRLYRDIERRIAALDVAEAI